MNKVKELIEKVLQRGWNDDKTRRLQQLFRECRNMSGALKLGELAKLRKLSKMLAAYCDSLTSQPGHMAEAVEVLLKEGFPRHPMYDYGKPEYLAFVHSPAPHEGGGHFLFKVKMTKKDYMGTRVDGSGNAADHYRTETRWGFGELSLRGQITQPTGGVETEAELDAQFRDMKKDFKIDTAKPKAVKLDYDLIDDDEEGEA